MLLSVHPLNRKKSTNAEEEKYCLKVMMSLLKVNYKMDFQIYNYFLQSQLIKIWIRIGALKGSI